MGQMPRLHCRISLMVLSSSQFKQVLERKQGQILSIYTWNSHLVLVCLPSSQVLEQELQLPHASHSRLNILGVVAFDTGRIVAAPIKYITIH